MDKSYAELKPIVDMARENENAVYDAWQHAKDMCYEANFDKDWDANDYWGERAFILEEEFRLAQRIYDRIANAASRAYDRENPPKTRECK